MGCGGVGGGEVIRVMVKLAIIIIIVITVDHYLSLRVFLFKYSKFSSPRRQGGIDSPLTKILRTRPCAKTSRPISGKGGELGR